MPIYEWECLECGKITEKIVQLNSADEEEFTGPYEQCECGNRTFKKLMSSNTFRLKGAGWEKDGYSK